MAQKSLDQLRELNEQGRVLYSVDNYGEALKYFRQAEELDPYYQPTYLNMGVCYVMMDRNDLARQTFEKLLKLDKKCAAAYFHLGNIALLENKAAEAKAAYSKAELCGYEDPVMYTNMAVFYEDEGDYESAAAQYNKILRKDPYDMKALGKKAQMQLRAGKFEDALQTARTMVATDVDQFDGHHYLYVSLIMLGRMEEAETCLQELTKRFPDNRNVRFDRARFYDMAGDPDKALKVLNEDFPDPESYPQVPMLKLGLLLQQQKLDDALAFVSRSPSLQKDPQALTLMYSAYYGRGDYPAALEACEKLRALGPGSTQYYAVWYFEPLARKKMGQAEQAEKAFRKAADDLKALCLEHPTQVDFYLYRALCEYQLGDLKEAKKLIDYLLAVKNDEAVLHLAAFEIYSAAGDAETAEQHRRTAAELNPDMKAPPV